METKTPTLSPVEAAVTPPSSVGTPPPPYPYDPGFYRGVTWLSGAILCASLALLAWLSVTIPRLDRVPQAERALQLMVGRLMEVEAGIKALPPWEQGLYALVMGSGAHDREQAIEWYRELADESPDPFVDLHLAVLEAESGSLQEVRLKAGRWQRQGDPFRLFAQCLEAAYWGGPGGRSTALELQAHMAEWPISGWFYARLAGRLAQRAGDGPLLATIEGAAQKRVARLVTRSRLLAWAEVGLMVTGLGLFLQWLRRGRPADRFRVGAATLPPLWAGGLGMAVLLRGGAIGALITLTVLFTAGDIASLRVLAVPLSNLPLLALAYVHLFRPQRQTFASGLGLRLQARRLPHVGLVLMVVVAAGLVGEWVLGRIAEPFQLVGHWTEWFDADLAWGAPSTLLVSLSEYVLFAPLFEELAFRGLLFAVLRRRFVWWSAAAMSALLFAVAHGYGLIGFLSVLWSGLVWAWAYERTGSLWPGILGHAVNNLLVCLSLLTLLRP